MAERTLEYNVVVCVYLDGTIDVDWETTLARIGKENVWNGKEWVSPDTLTVEQQLRFEELIGTIIIP